MSTVSVIIPVYNASKSLNKTLESLINQTYSDLEIILINDGSKDSSLDICRQYAEKDSRITVLTHENHGVSYTRNRGLDIATGKYLMFLDGDDTFDSEMIQKYVEIAEKTNADVVIGGITFLSENHQKKELLPKKQGLFSNEIWNDICMESSGLFGYVPNKLYSLDIIQQNHIQFNEEYYAQEDLDFALSIYFYCNSFYLLQYSGYYYDYIPSKRTDHPYKHYLANKIKMLDYGNQKTTLTNSSKKAVMDEIESLLYTTMYWRESSQLSNLVEELLEISDLKRVLSEYGYSRLTTKLLVQKKVGLLKLYFFSRKSISKIIHRN